MFQLSVIIPTWNSEKTIERCLASVCSYTNIVSEVIIVDDCSTDKTVQKVKAFAEIGCPKLIILKNEAREGPSYSRNVGIKNSKSPYIMFVDSDDYIYLDVDLIVESLRNGTDYLASSHYQIHTKSSGEINSRRLNDCGLEVSKVKTHSMTSKCFSEYLSNYLKMPRKYCLFEHCWGKIYKKEVITKNNIIFNTHMFQLEDVLFNLEYLKYCSSIQILAFPTYYHSQNDNPNRLSVIAGIDLRTVKDCVLISNKCLALIKKSQRLDKLSMEILQKSFLASKISSYIIRLSKISIDDVVARKRSVALISYYRSERLYKNFIKASDESILIQLIIRYLGNIYLIRNYSKLRTYINKVRINFKLINLQNGNNG